MMNLKKWFNEMWFRVLLGMTLGILCGGIWFSIFQNTNTYTYILNWIAFPGHLFLKLIQMIMIPLMVSSIMYGVGNMSIHELKKTGGWVALYFVITSVIAICFGIVISYLLKPWRWGTFSTVEFANKVVHGSNTSSETLFSNPSQYLNYIIPGNIFSALVHGEMFPLVVFSVFVGVALSSIRTKEAVVFLKVLLTIQDLMLTITKWVMILAPIAVFGLMVHLVGQIGFSILLSLGMYVCTVVCGMLAMIMVYFFIVQIMSGKSFVEFLQAIKEVILLAFSVASSAPTLPLSMKVASEELKAPQHLVQFILPVGATMSMDGTALYQTVAAIFIAHVYQVPLDIPQILLLAMSITMASIGTPSAPGAGIMVLGAILTSVGIPIEGISLILGVDRILGMIRAGINVISDLSAVVLFSVPYQNKNQ